MSSHCHLETLPGHLVLAREEACVVYEHIHPRRLELIDQATDRIEGGNIHDVEVHICWFGLAGNPPLSLEATLGIAAEHMNRSPAHRKTAGYLEPESAVGAGHAASFVAHRAVEGVGSEALAE